MATAPDNPTPVMDHLTNLPTELLLLIGENLDLCSRLQLRRVLPKSHSKVAVKLLGGAAQTLFVAPTKSSVKRFEAICGSETFRHHVKKVVFIPRILIFPNSTALHDSVVGYRQRNQELSETEAEASLSLFLRILKQLKQYFIDLCVEHDEYYDYENEDDLTMSMKLSKSLQRGLVQLPALKAIGIMNTIDEEGLNASWGLLGGPLKTILSTQRPHAGVKSTAAILHTLAEMHEAEYVNTFVHAIHHVAPRLESLFLGRSHTDFSQMFFHAPCYTMIKSPRFRAVLKDITMLEISCLDGDNFGPEDDPRIWPHIARSVAKLQTLKLWLCPSSDPDQWLSLFWGERVIDDFLDEGCYPDLRKFEVQGCPKAMTAIKTAKLNKFLADHSNTLEEVRLRNVFVTEKFFVVQDGVLNVDQNEEYPSMRRFLDGNRALISKLKKFELIKSRNSGEWVDYTKVDSGAERFVVTEESM